MAQLIMALGIVCALVYFIFFRAPTEDTPIQAPAAYKTEIEKAQNVEQALQDAAKQRSEDSGL